MVSHFNQPTIPEFVRADIKSQATPLLRNEEDKEAGDAKGLRKKGTRMLKKDEHNDKL